MAQDELAVAKINAAVKILEWSKDNIEPGIGGTPNQLHVALADAFRTIYDILNEAVGESTPAGQPVDEDHRQQNRHE